MLCRSSFADAIMSITVADLLQDKAKQSPNSTLFSIGPDTPVAEAVSAMVRHEISSIVVKENDDMVGLITLREILMGLNSHGGALMQAKCRHVMKPNPPVAKPEDSVDHLRGLMTELHITHVPVMTDGIVVGILSFHDIARSAIKDVAFENQLLKQYIKNWPA
jgi:predicted transcriptional regulator